jgi:hypothetical protein
LFTFNWVSTLLKNLQFILFNFQSHSVIAFQNWVLRLTKRRFFNKDWLFTEIKSLLLLSGFKISTTTFKIIFLQICSVMYHSAMQCPRADLNKKFLPRPKTTTAWKGITHRSKISKNWNPPYWDPLQRFFKNWFLLYSNYIQTHFT